MDDQLKNIEIFMSWEEAVMNTAQRSAHTHIPTLHKLALQ